MIFPTAQVVGCWFHFSQAVFKYMSGLGLKEQYSKNPAFAKWFKMVLALPLLPTDRITSMWNELKSDPIPNAEHIPKISNIALKKQVCSFSQMLKHQCHSNKKIYLQF